MSPRFGIASPAASSSSESARSRIPACDRDAPGRGVDMSTDVHRVERQQHPGRHRRRGERVTGADRLDPLAVPVGAGDDRRPPRRSIAGCSTATARTPSDCPPSCARSALAGTASTSLTPTVAPTAPPLRRGARGGRQPARSAVDVCDVCRFIEPACHPAGRLRQRSVAEPGVQPCASPWRATGPARRVRRGGRRSIEPSPSRDRHRGARRAHRRRTATRTWPGRSRFARTRPARHHCRTHRRQARLLAMAAS